MNEKITMYSPPFPRLKSYIDVIDLACEFGVGSVEPFCMFEFEEPDTDKAREVKAYADKKGIVFPCISVYTTIVEKDLKAEADRLKKFADVAAVLESPFLHHTIVGEVQSPLKVLPYRNELMEKGIELVRDVYDYAESIGIRTVYEDQGFIFNGVKGFGEFIDKVDRNVGVVADFGNICQAGERIEGFIDAFHDRVVHAHIKDMVVSDNAQSGSPTLDGKYMKSVEVGTGNIDCKKVIELLKSYGYDGYYGVEYAVLEDDSPVIEKVFRQIDQWMK